MSSCPSQAGLRLLAPNRTAVILQHGFEFDPSAWQGELAEFSRSWPPALDRLGPSPTPDRERQGLRLITRADVFALVESADSPEAALKGYVATMVWGCGMRARPRRRCLNALGGRGAAQLPDRVGEKLIDALDIARKTSPIDAFDALHGEKAKIDGTSIHGLGPAYGTKLLYFGAYSSHAGPLRPLIMDSNVVKALNWIRETSWDDYTWDTGQYREYLELADEWARRWNTEPDVIERVLFEVGQSRKLAIESLLG